MRKAFLIMATLSCMMAAAQTLSKEQRQVKDAAIAFFRWYAKGHVAFDTPRPYVSVNKGSDGPPYKISPQRVKAHLAWVSQQKDRFSKQFLINEGIWFRYADSLFKASPGEEIAAGFDFDRILGGQEEPGIVLKDGWLSKKMVWDITLLNPNKALVSIHEPFQEVLPDDANTMIMEKENGRWKVSLPPGMYGAGPFQTIGKQ